MIIIIEIAIVLAYMTSSMLGVALMTIISAYVFFREKNKVYALLQLMIISLPMAYIGIAGQTMHQMFSWYNIFLFIFLLIVLRYGSKIVAVNRAALCSFFVMLLCMTTNLFWSTSIDSSLVEFAQMVIMIIPLMTIHSLRKKFPLETDKVYSLIWIYVDVCVATAICMLIQLGIYRFGHRVIGAIQYTGAGRVQCFCLFKGASILPIFMGIGIIFLFIECFERKMTVGKLIEIVLVFLAMVLNSSRTGLLMLMVVMAFVLLKYYHRTLSVKGLFVSIICFVGGYYAINYITTLRSGLSGFLDANGRIGTWENGIKIWSANIKNLLIGEGFSGERWWGVTKPHNMVLQLLAQCGLISSVIILAWMVKYLVDNLRNPYIFLPVFIILSCMLVTDFYANAFTTVIFILVDLYSGTIYEGKTDDCISGEIE